MAGRVGYHARNRVAGGAELMSFSESISPFLGRCALSWFFGAGAYNIVHNFAQLSQELTAKHVPMPPLLLVLYLCHHLYTAALFPPVCNASHPPLRPLRQKAVILNA